jgi:peptidyl-prolyl cis-trans isomerase A (cyclophilin A)
VRRFIPFIALALAAVIPAIGQTQKLADGLYAEIRTERGTIVCQLEFQKVPMTVSNFVGLAEGTLAANGASGRRFYDGLTFHRVVAGFVIQGGDPKGDGSGGPGYQIPNETRPELKHDAAGVLAMANSGPDTNGSQFYITMGPASHLDGGYSVFGHVVQGQDVVSSVKQGDHLISVRIIRVGAAAGAFTVTQKGFDAMVAGAWAGVAERKKKDRGDALALIKKQWPRLTTTKSGLMYEVLIKGSGGSPGATAAVSIAYKGMLIDGRVFADSSTSGSAVAVQMDKLALKGWTEALLTMGRGEKRRLVIPPELAFGSRGYSNIVAPDAFVVFELQLVDF